MDLIKLSKPFYIFFVLFIMQNKTFLLDYYFGMSSLLIAEVGMFDGLEKIGKVQSQVRLV
jgi:hypothetical protein